MRDVGILEGILFVVGDEGITLDNLCDIMSKSETEVKNLLSILKKNYEEDDRGIRISYLGDAFKLTTKPEHKEIYEKLVKKPESNTLSPAALETLAIIAYNGPITRVEIDELRGVSTVFVIRKLLARELIKVSGKSTLPGKPNLYEVTNNFLDYFGLATINDLPKFKNGNDNEELDLYLTKYNEDEEK